jgi:uncharacterized membrane protein
MRETPSKILSVDELRRMRAPVRHVTASHKEKMSRLDSFAIWTTEKVGSIGFFFLVMIWTATWLLWNVWGPEGLRFDPMPGFVLWLFISNILQLIFMPLIMVGQNLMGRHSDERSEKDYIIDTTTEREVEQVLLRLDKQEKILQDIMDRMRS